MLYRPLILMALITTTIIIMPTSARLDENGNVCKDFDCGPKCLTPFCSIQCNTKDCGAQCLNNGCAIHCAGPNCGKKNAWEIHVLQIVLLKVVSQCIGNYCAASCSAPGCGNRCVGEGCAAGCSLGGPSQNSDDVGDDCGEECLGLYNELLPCSLHETANVRSGMQRLQHEIYRGTGNNVAEYVLERTNKLQTDFAEDLFYNAKNPCIWSPDNTCNRKECLSEWDGDLVPKCDECDYARQKLQVKNNMHFFF